MLADFNGRAGKDLFEALLREGVVVRPMAGYGFPSALRVTVGLRRENERLLAALAEDPRRVTAGRPFIVAIDGPAGAGKSTAARRVASRLGFAMVDTGAIYRTVALAAFRRGIALDDDAALAGLLPELEIHFAPCPGGGQRVLLGADDVSVEIRTPPMSLGASKVSARPVVRAGLLDLQRRLALAPENRGAVLEGRDIGTVVFPDADAKFFLTAAPDERARRRHAELGAKGDPSTYDEVLADQLRRDRDDSERAVAPLPPADDAKIVDTSGLPLEAVVEPLVREIEGAGVAASGVAWSEERRLRPKGVRACRLWRPILEDARGPIGPCRLRCPHRRLPGTAPACERYLSRSDALPSAPPPVEPRRRSPSRPAAPLVHRGGGAACPPGRQRPHRGPPRGRAVAPFPRSSPT